jgi:hypothetical protein
MSQFDNMQDDALDGRSLGGKGQDMTRTPLLITLAAAAALAGCNKENHTIVAGPPDDEQNAAHAPVALPPSITATKVYRCADNQVVYVNWMSDGSANVKDKPGGAITPVPAGSPDLQGDASAKSVTYKGKSCKA